MVLFYFDLMLRIVNMSKNFSSQTVTPQALDKVNLEIKPGEFFSLLGPSGCGKTTLLRIIAGLETASSGELFWNNSRLDSVKPQDRPFNIVFQRYALFPHLSVFENIEFGLKIKGFDKNEIRTRVEEVLNLVDLWFLRDRLPETLSGGQAQRVAVARAVVNRPQILLLDEPLSALDQKMRVHMQSELRELQRRLKITFILVTHDQEEALALSDRIAVMNRGQIEQVSAPRELYESPQTYFVAQFVGSMGSIVGSRPPALVESRNADDGDDSLISVKLDSGEIISGINNNVGADYTNLEFFIRPENIRLQPQARDNEIETEIVSIAFKGLHSELILGVHSSQRLRVFIKPNEVTSKMCIGAKLKVYFSPQDTFAFAQPKGKAQ